MYGQQQFSNPIAIAAKWWFFGLVGLVIMGILLGANIQDATWFNSDIAAAQAKGLEIETAHQQAVYQLQEQLARAKTEADIQAIRRQQKLLDARYEHDLQALAQDLELRQRWSEMWMTVFTFLGGAVSIAIVLGAILWAGSKALANVLSVPQERPAQTVVPPDEDGMNPLPEKEPDNPWNSPVYQYQRRIAAQREERKRRTEVVARMKAHSDPGAEDQG